MDALSSALLVEGQARRRLPKNGEKPRQVTRARETRNHRFIAAALVVALMAESAHAQEMSGGCSGGGGRKQHQQKTDKPDTPKPKVDDKAL